MTKIKLYLDKLLLNIYFIKNYIKKNLYYFKYFIFYI